MVKTIDDKIYQSSIEKTGKNIFDDKRIHIFNFISFFLILCQL